MKRKFKSEKIDMRRPSLFRDEDPNKAIKKAIRISDLKNLGPATEKSMNSAGIKKVQQFVNLGWKKTMVKLINENSKNCHSIFAYALIGALSNTDWNRITDEEKLEARNFIRSFKLKMNLKKIPIRK